MYKLMVMVSLLGVGFGFMRFFIGGSMEWGSIVVVRLTLLARYRTPVLCIGTGDLRKQEVLIVPRGFYVGVCVQFKIIA
jgi:hypothetical protein